MFGSLGKESSLSLTLVTVSAHIVLPRLLQCGLGVRQSAGVAVFLIVPFPKFLEALPGSDVTQSRVKELMEWNGCTVNSLPLLLTLPQVQVTSFFRLIREL